MYRHSIAQSPPISVIPLYAQIRYILANSPKRCLSRTIQADVWSLSRAIKPQRINTSILHYALPHSASQLLLCYMEHHETHQTPFFCHDTPLNLDLVLLATSRSVIATWTTRQRFRHVLSMFAANPRYFCSAPSSCQSSNHPCRTGSSYNLSVYWNHIMPATGRQVLSTPLTARLRPPYSIFTRCFSSTDAGYCAANCITV